MSELPWNVWETCQSTPEMLGDTSELLCNAGKTSELPCIVWGTRQSSSEMLGRYQSSSAVLGRCQSSPKMFGGHVTSEFPCIVGEDTSELPCSWRTPWLSTQSLSLLCFIWRERFFTSIPSPLQPLWNRSYFHGKESKPQSDIRASPSCLMMFALLWTLGQNWAVLLGPNGVFVCLL